MSRVMVRLLPALAVLAGTSAGALGQEHDLLPWPKEVTWLAGRVRLDAQACFVRAEEGSAAMRTGIDQVRERIRSLGGPQLPRVKGLDGASAFGAWIWVGTVDELPKLGRLLGSEQTVPRAMGVPDGYVLRCERVGDRDVVVCLGHDGRGCYYGMQTLAQLLSADGEGVSLPRVEIADWPSFRIRLVKNSATNSDPAMVEQFAGLLPRYKINVYALQYHSETGGTWREPSQRYRDVIQQVGKIARRDGVLEGAFYLCPFFKPRIVLTNESDVELYTDRLRWGIEQGYDWIEVDFNDWAKWQYATEAEKARFGDMGGYMAHLTNAAYEAIRPEYPDVGIIVCPTHPWYRGQARSELVAMCESIPEDILVYWTGPVTRSRSINVKQAEDWELATGRKPFLWDNTIYAHFQPYWLGYAFNPFVNSFPPNLPELLAGPGVHLNCTPLPHYVPGILTYADYLWNPEGYDPRRSIRTALRLCWGEDAPDAAREVQERLVALYKMLYVAGKGWQRYDRGRADAMLAELEAAVRDLAEVAGDPALTADMEASFLSEVRTVIEEFEPPEELAPWPEPIPRSLADGAVNPSAEEVADGKPVGWSLYQGAGAAKMTVSPDAHTGERSVCLEATKWYHDLTHAVHGDRRWISVALVQGSELGGKDGRDAYDVEPYTSYRISFYLKGDVPAVRIRYQGWYERMDRNSRHTLYGHPEEIRPTAEWKRYTGTVDADFAMRKLALQFGIVGYEDEGMRLGRIWVDDVSIEPVK